MKILTINLFLILAFSTICSAQFFVPPADIVEKAPKWAQLMYSENPNVFEVEEAYRNYYQGKTIKKDMHTRNRKFWKKSIQFRIKRDGSLASSKDEIYLERQTKNHQFKNQNNLAGGWSLVGPLQSLAEDNVPGSDQTCVFCIDQSISDPNILFCGTQPGEVYKSTDGGDNWTNMSLNLVLPFEDGGIVSIAIHPIDSDKVYFTVQDMIYRSINGGLTWDLLSTIDNPNDLGVLTEKIFIHPNQPNIMMVVSSIGLYRSTDGGNNWTTVFDNPSYDILMNTASDNIIYTLRKNENTELHEFLISTDFGASFTIQNNGLHTSTDPERIAEGGKLAVTAADPDRVYAYLAGQSKPGDYGYIGIYRSDDGGNTWTLPNGPAGGPYSVSHPNLASQDGLNDNFFADMSFNALAASNDDPNKILIGGLNLWKSDDGGETFQALGGYIDGPFNDAIHVGDFHVDMQEFKVTGNKTWITTDGGIYKSSDFFSTTNFEKKNNGVHSTDFWGFGSGWNQDVIVGGVYHNGVLAYNETYGEGNFLIIDGGEPSTGYVNPGENNLVYSSEGGSGILPDAVGPIEGFDFDFIPNESYNPLAEGYSDIVFHPQCYSVAFTGKRNELWRTIDKGLSFQKIKTFGSETSEFITYIHISRDNPDLLYAMQTSLNDNQSNKLWKSLDAGETWSEITLPSDIFRHSVLQVDPFDPSRIWISSSFYEAPSLVYQSVDGGITWTDITTPTIANEYAITLDYIPGTNGGLYLGTHLGMYYKDDSMSDWIDFSDGLPAVSTARKSRPFYRDNKLRISSTKGIWESELFERPNMPFAQIMVDRIETCAEVGSTFKFVDYSMLKHEGATWEWTFEGATPSTASTWSAETTFNTAGTHQVILKITDDRGLVDSDTLEINIASVLPSIDILFDQEECGDIVSINTFSNNKSLLVSPNPSSGIFNIEYYTHSKNNTVQIFNTAGKILLKEVLPESSHDKIQYSIDLSHLAKGSYILKIEGSSEIRIEKIIVL